MLLLLAAACATDSGRPQGADTSDTGSLIALVAENAPVQIVRSRVRPEPVEVTQSQYEAAMVRLSLKLRDKLPARPERRVDIVSWGSPEQPDERAQLVRDYYQWCEQRGTPGACLMESNALFMANQGTSKGGGSGSRSSLPAPAPSASKYRLRSIEDWRKPPFASTRCLEKSSPDCSGSKAEGP